MLRIGRMPAVYWRAGLHFLVHSFCGWESWATGRTGSGEKKEFVLQAIPIEYKSLQEETNTAEEEDTNTTDPYKKHSNQYNYQDEETIDHRKRIYFYPVIISYQDENRSKLKTTYPCGVSRVPSFLSGGAANERY